MPPTLKKFGRGEGAYCIWVVRPSACPSVTLCDACHIFGTVHASVLKFHVWIPRGTRGGVYETVCL